MCDLAMLWSCGSFLIDFPKGAWGRILNKEEVYHCSASCGNMYWYCLTAHKIKYGSWAKEVL